MVRYFEFNKADYYAMLVVEENKNAMMKAMKLYVEQVAYESVLELRLEGAHPEEISKEKAFLKFVTAISETEKDRTVSDVVGQFENAKDETLLIDSSLV